MRLSHLLVSLCTVASLARAQEKPQPLPTVPVTAEAELVRSAKLREFDRRRSNGIGRFLTEADLEKDQYRQLSDVLKKLPGITFARAKSMPGVSPLACLPSALVDPPRSRTSRRSSGRTARLRSGWMACRSIEASIAPRRHQLSVPRYRKSPAEWTSRLTTSTAS